MMQQPNQVESQAEVDEAAWYVVHCKWLKEAYAEAALELLLGVTVYLPAVEQRLRGQLRRVPFFPGYLFALADLKHVPPSRIQSIPGVIRLVAFEERPQPVAAPVVEFIRQQVHALNMHGGLPIHSFKPGDLVRFRSGPFQGLEAVFQGPTKPSERVQVLLEFLGDARTMSVEASKLESTNTGSASPHAPRRTRGRGRFIHLD